MYRLTFAGKAVEDLKRIDLPFQKIIKQKLLLLSQDPAVLKNNIKRLSGQERDLFRLRIGSYRVVFKKKEKEMIILVIRIGHRKEIYWSLN